MKKCLLILILNSTFLILYSFSFAQNKNIDSLQALLKSDKADTNKVNHSNKLCKEYINIGLNDTAIYYGIAAIQLSQNLNFKNGIALSYNLMELVFLNLGDYPKSLDYYSKSLSMYDEIGNKEAISKTIGNTGTVYWRQGDYPKALEFFFRALKIDEGSGNKRGIARGFNLLGLVYSDQGDYPKASDYLSKSLKMNEGFGDKNGIAVAFGNLGNIYYRQAGAEPNAFRRVTLYNKTLDYHLKALKITEEIGDKNGIARHLGNIGSVYTVKGDYSKALGYYLKALKMAQELGYKNGIARHLDNIGLLFTYLKKYKEAYNYVYRALELSNSMGAKNNIRDNYINLSNLYELSNISLPDSTGGKLLTMDKMRLRSLYYYKRSIAIRDILFGEENKKQLVRKEMNFEFDKKEAATKAGHDKEMAVAEAEKKKQKIVIWSVITGLLLVIVFSFFMFNRWRITRQQKDIIEKQKEKIMASITYAQRIQQSILMEESEIHNYLPDCFIYFQPKDIVSGDFYWCTKIDGKIILAAIDCTGHGVPGAFMSMIGNTLLNQIVNEKHITRPSEILQLLNLGVFEALHQEKDGALSRDGMDVALCCIDYKNNEVQFAGAQNPLYVVSNNVPLECIPMIEEGSHPHGEITVYKGDGKGIGGGGNIAKLVDPTKTTYTNHILPIKKGMSIYLFSDGYMDQFGGSNRKKFGIQQFKELVLNNQHLGMQKQKELVALAHHEWRGNSNQIDDILVIGVRL